MRTLTNSQPKLKWKMSLLARLYFRLTIFLSHTLILTLPSLHFTVLLSEVSLFVFWISIGILGSEHTERGEYIAFRTTLTFAQSHTKTPLTRLFIALFRRNSKYMFLPLKIAIFALTTRLCVCVFVFQP